MSTSKPGCPPELAPPCGFVAPSPPLPILASAPPVPPPLAPPCTLASLPPLPADAPACPPASVGRSFAPPAAVSSEPLHENVASEHTAAEAIDRTVAPKNLVIELPTGFAPRMAARSGRSIGESGVREKRLPHELVQVLGNLIERQGYGHDSGAHRRAGHAVNNGGFLAFGDHDT